jgi:phospholipase C
MSLSRTVGFLTFVSLLLVLSACGGIGSTPGPGSSPTPVNPAGDIHSVNHIILMYQENRSFDHYFGDLNNYRQAHGVPADVDVAPAGVTNPARDGSGPVARFHFTDKCIESLSPFWNESHRDFNLNDPTSSTATLDGFASVAGGFAMATGEADVAGKRAMGFYTGQDLPYYYFMATQFATSDRWFSPVMNRTQLNRIFGMAGTDAGFIYPPGNAGFNDPTPFPAIKNIFQLLEEAHITWRIYSAAGSEDLAGLSAHTYLSYFQPFATEQKSHIVSRSQFLTDVQNGTLPQVALIEPDSADEHPNTDFQVGAKAVSNLMNAVMNSSSWKDSVFIFTYDEGGSFYDHVAPQPAVLPDSFAPRFQTAFDIPGTFDHTGYRVPLIVISPNAKKNFDTHTVMDYTAILKFIETRFNLPNLTARDKAQPDMTEFFDFVNPPWMTPPAGIPTQPTTGPCTFLIP